MENCTPAEAVRVYRRFSTHPYLRLKCRSYERRLNNFRIFRALITESQSHFETSERLG